MGGASRSCFHILLALTLLNRCCGVHQLPLWPVPEPCFPVELQGVSRGTCNSRRLQAAKMIVPQCTLPIVRFRVRNASSRMNVPYFGYSSPSVTHVLYCAGLLLPGCRHDLLLVPSRLLLPRKLMQLLRVSHRKVFHGDEVSVHQLPLWPVPERRFSDKLQGVSRGTCKSRRLQAAE